jgi:hypothetical protein
MAKIKRKTQMQMIADGELIPVRIVLPVEAYNRLEPFARRQHHMKLNQFVEKMVIDYSRTLLRGENSFKNISSI